MSIAFEELDYRATPLGELVLRRRSEPRLRGKEIYEVKLGEEFLMSSLFTEGEVALAELGLSDLGERPLDVVVGGLGLGFTAAAALDKDNVRSMLIVDALAEVIEWHQRGLIPLGERLSADPRCRYVHGDFFSLASAAEGFDPESPGRCFDVVLLDIDHSPRHWLHPGNASFYQQAGLERLMGRLNDDGVFALWSNDPPDDVFMATLGKVSKAPMCHEIAFRNPYTGGQSSNTVYVARKLS